MEDILSIPVQKNIELVSVKIRRDLYTDYTVNHPEDVIPIIGELIGDSDREHIVILNCTARNRVINYSISATGYATGAYVSPVDMLRTTVLSGASVFFMAHNHPSGFCSPSEEDNVSTSRMAACAKLLNLNMMDHIILGGSSGPLFSYMASNPELLNPDIKIMPGIAAPVSEYGLRELTTDLVL